MCFRFTLSLIRKTLVGILNVLNTLMHRRRLIREKFGKAFDFNSRGLFVIIPEVTMYLSNLMLAFSSLLSFTIFF